MKIVISAVAIVVLMIGAPSAYAISDYQSEFKHGGAMERLNHRLTVRVLNHVLITF
jgi:hypothetical protein